MQEKILYYINNILYIVIFSCTNKVFTNTILKMRVYFFKVRHLFWTTCSNWHCVPHVKLTGWCGGFHCALLHNGCRILLHDQWTHRTSES